MSYVAILTTSALITVIGAAALTATRVQWRFAEQSNDHIAARFYAQSAIERGFAVMQSNPGWTTTPGAGTWLSNAPWDRGTFNLEVQPGPGGDWIMTATGAKGEAEHRLQVTVRKSGASTTLLPGSWKRVVTP